MAYPLGIEQELWKYSYPLHQKNTVPAWTVPLIATVVPLLIIAAIGAYSKFSRLELHNLILGLFASVFITACITNLVKLGVRHRPFNERVQNDSARIPVTLALDKTRWTQV